MDTSRFLITGANGQLGRALSERYPNAIKTGHQELDITDRSSVEAFDWSKVDVILNAAVFSNVDGAETAEGRVAAWQVNAVAVGHLSTVAAKHDLTLVHVSSDYVFDGTKDLHDEDELFSPLGVYAQTKAAGDIAAGIVPKHYILRTSWVIGDGKNFVRTMTGLAEKNISPAVVSDQIGRLTFTSTLTDAVDHLLSAKAAYGTYNVSNEGEPVSWADVTREIFAALGRNDLTVTDTTTQEYFASKPESAPRPLLSTLNLSKMKATGLSLRDWKTDLQDYIASEKESMTA